MSATSQMIQHESKVRVWLLTAEISILWHHSYETRLMTAVVEARNTIGPHNSATGPFSEPGMCCGDLCNWKTHEILIIWLSQFGYMCLLRCLSLWRIALLNNHISWSKIIEWNKLHSFEVNSHKCNADVSFLCQCIMEKTLITIYPIKMPSDFIHTWTGPIAQ